MTLRPRRCPAAPLSLPLRRYLETGAYVTPGEPADVDVYRLAGQVIRRNLVPLAPLWRAHGAEILSNWRGPGRPWALSVLKPEEGARC